MQYHFNTKETVSPYVGVGLNYSHLFSVKVPGAGPVTSITYTDSVGPAAQVGVDSSLNERWSLNVDLKKIWLQTDVSLNGGAITGDVDLDPWIVGVGFGYRF